MEICSIGTGRDFERACRILEARQRPSMKLPEERVGRVVRSVVNGGDTALFEIVSACEGYEACPETIQATPAQVQEAFSVVPEDARRALVECAANLENFHKRQLRDDWFIERPDGSFTGMRSTPVRSAGMCVAGGSGAAASTVLMDVIPARIAGVDNITVCLPAPRGIVNPLSLVAAHVAGADRILRMSGAAAVAALACGTESVPRADVVVASGSMELRMARQLLGGWAGGGICSAVPGLAIIADEQADPDIIAADLVAQAQRGEGVLLTLATTSRSLAEAVENSVGKWVLSLGEEEREAADEALDQCMLVACRDLAECCAVIDRLAPDQLEILARDPQKILFDVRNAGLVLVGENSPPASAAYLAGVNHILPTGGTARFDSPLTVDTFRKQTAIVYFTRAEMESTIGDAALFARAEGLEVLARSMETRRREADSDA